MRVPIDGAASGFEIHAHTMPMLDTGIGVEMGYENDEAFLAAAEAERMALDPEVRQAAESFEATMQRKLLGL